MRYTTRHPGPRLAPFVQSLWLYEGEPRSHALERILPTGTAQLIVNLAEDETRVYDARRIECCEPAARCERMAGTVLCGAHSRYCVIDTAEQQVVIGASFRPGGAFPFFGMPAGHLANTHVPLDALWGRRRAARLRERVLGAPTAEAKLAALEDELCALSPPRGLHPAVAFALTAFGRAPGTTTVAGVTDAIGLSPKRFIERFKAEVGLTPKMYCRVRRFQRALAAARAGRGVDWSTVALGCGYFDQAHFIHDFRAFSGMTPTGYRVSRTEYQNHVKFLQSEDRAL
jgi:AraC-like DNA-binding protein